MRGLGRPLNWVVEKIMATILRRHLKTILELEAKEVIQQELSNTSATDDMLGLFPSLFP